jgi:TatD DNase family protein
MVILFDSHAHINIETYDEIARAEVVAAIEASDVGYVIDIGFDVKSSEVATLHAQKYPWCYAAVGVHPSDVATMTDESINALRALAARDKVVAVGEIGLDYHYDDAPSTDVQRHWFRKQLMLGIELGMPITIHDRDTDGETRALLIENGAFAAERTALFASAQATGAHDARILLHCFSGDAKEALSMIGMGAWISVAGPVTFKNNKKTQEVAATVPLSRLLIETDSPYLTPVPHRGEPNMPPYVEFTARKIAELRGISYEEIAAATTANAKRFYGIIGEGRAR